MQMAGLSRHYHFWVPDKVHLVPHCDDGHLCSANFLQDLPMKQYVNIVLPIVTPKEPCTLQHAGLNQLLR